jgi:hypothetical protein
MNSTTKALFPLGQVVSTPGAIEAFMQEEGCGMSEFLLRHVSGDWGELDSFDKRQNDEAVSEGLRIFSVYVLPRTKIKIWVITEADRSATTFLLPSEY